ncbi:hypothetical protein ACP4OV_021321 [Aristida adscensionis]
MDQRRHDTAVVGAGGRLRQSLAQLLLRSSCTAAAASAASFVGLAKNNAVAAAAITNSAAAAAAAAAASRHEAHPAGRRASCAQDHKPRPELINTGRQRRHRRRSARALVHISIDCSARSVGAAAVPSPLVPAKDVDAAKSRATRQGSGRKLRPPPCTWTWSSSTDTDGELAPFSSDGERCSGEPADARSSTLFSSLSFSSDSTSDFYNTTTGGGGGRSKRHKNPPRRRAPPRRAPHRAGAKTGDAFRPPAPDADRHGKGTNRKHGAAMAASGSTAVVKRSHNPYADFRSSMVEMVAGRRIRGADALSELLVWYLSLNSPEHHPAILAAFEDVWEAVLGSDDP